MRFFAASGALHNHRLHPPRGSSRAVKAGPCFSTRDYCTLYTLEVQSWPSTTVSPFHQQAAPVRPICRSKDRKHGYGMARDTHLGTKQRHSAGSIVKVEGETCFGLFYIDEGKVHVVFDTIDGRMRSVVSFEPGSIFNLAPAATRCEASGQYQCMTDAVIWQIPGKVLHDPVFAARYPNLMLSVIELLGTLVLTYHTYLTDMLMDDFVTRFSRFLISLSLERGSDEFPLGMTQEQLASVFGVHRATLARAIQHLKQEAIMPALPAAAWKSLIWNGWRHMAHL